MQESRPLSLVPVVATLATAAGCSGLGETDVPGHDAAGTDLPGERLGAAPQPRLFQQRKLR